MEGLRKIATISESITLQGNSVYTVTLITLDRDTYITAQLFNTLRNLLKKQAAKRLADARKRRAELFERLDAVLEEEDRLTRMVDALHDPADNYRQNIWDSFPGR